jgi:hypothetical protein
MDYTALYSRRHYSSEQEMFRINIVETNEIYFMPNVIFRKSFETSEGERKEQNVYSMLKLPNLLSF